MQIAKLILALAGMVLAMLFTVATAQLELNYGAFSTVVCAAAVLAVLAMLSSVWFMYDAGRHS